MSAPIIQSTAPAATETDVVLGRPIEIFFDQAIDPTTVSSKTFSLMGPGTTSVIDQESFIRKQPKAQTGLDYVPGVFSFPSPDHLIFTPSRPLRPNVQYTVLLVGKNAALVTSYIGTSTDPMAASYQFTFTTGQLSGSQPPLQSPITPSRPWDKPVLDPEDIQVQLLPRDGNSPDRTIVMTFPAAIDVASFDHSLFLVAAQPLMNDPGVPIPQGVTTDIQLAGNTATIVLHGIEN